MTTTYDEAARALWGDAGAYVHHAYRQRLHLFDNLPEELPIVIGITAYGKCIGLTRYDGVGLDGPRITIASNLFKQGVNAVADTMLHEMMHTSLGLAGRDPNHKGAAWYAECERLAPHVLGRNIKLQRTQRKSVRVPNPAWSEGSDLPKTVVRKVGVDVEFPHSAIARFPHPFRPEGYFSRGDVIEVPTY